MGKKKKIFLGFVGLPRKFEITHKNIYRNLINYNDDYDFDIYINTENNALNTVKNKIKKFHFNGDLENKLKDIYNKENKLIKIIYKKKKNNLIDFNFIFKRFSDLIKYADSINKNYYLYILIRFDVIINKPIKLDYFNENAMYNICSKYSGGLPLHNKDFDLMCITTKEAFNSWFFTEKYNFDICLNREELLKLNSIVRSNSFVTKRLINGDKSHKKWHVVHHYFKIFYYMLKKNLKYIFVDTNQYSTSIVR